MSAVNASSKRNKKKRTSSNASQPPSPNTTRQSSFPLSSISEKENERRRNHPFQLPIIKDDLDKAVKIADTLDYNTVKGQYHVPKDVQDECYGAVHKYEHLREMPPEEFQQKYGKKDGEAGTPLDQNDAITAYSQGFVTSLNHFSNHIISAMPRSLDNNRGLLGEQAYPMTHVFERILFDPVIDKKHIKDSFQQSFVDRSNLDTSSMFAISEGMKHIVDIRTKGMMEDALSTFTSEKPSLEVTQDLYDIAKREGKTDVVDFLENYQLTKENMKACERSVAVSFAVRDKIEKGELPDLQTEEDKKGAYAMLMEGDYVNMLTSLLTDDHNLEAEYIDRERTDRPCIKPDLKQTIQELGKLYTKEKEAQREAFIKELEATSVSEKTSKKNKKQKETASVLQVPDDTAETKSISSEEARESASIAGREKIRYVEQNTAGNRLFKTRYPANATYGNRLLMDEMLNIFTHWPQTFESGTHKAIDNVVTRAFMQGTENDVLGRAFLPSAEGSPAAFTFGDGSGRVIDPRTTAEGNGYLAHIDRSKHIFRDSDVSHLSESDRPDFIVGANKDIKTREGFLSENTPKPEFYKDAPTYPSTDAQGKLRLATTVPVPVKKLGTNEYRMAKPKESPDTVIHQRFFDLPHVDGGFHMVHGRTTFATAEAPEVELKRKKKQTPMVYNFYGNQGIRFGFVGGEQKKDETELDSLVRRYREYRMKNVS